MAGTPAAQRDKWHDFLRDHTNLGQQFGGGDDETTFNGATGCTHELLQMLGYANTGHLLSHDEISRIAGYPSQHHNPGRRGLRWNDDEMMKVVRHFKLPYTLWFHSGPISDSVWARLKDNLREGPVLTAVKYSHYPEDRGYVYAGRKADGQPNGFALANGKTQLSGAEGIAHAIGLISYFDSEKYNRFVFTAKEPNHGSPSRPEKPPFDIITPTQVKVAINSIRLFRIDGRAHSLMFLIPTRTFVPR